MLNAQIIKPHKRHFNFLCFISSEHFSACLLSLMSRQKPLILFLGDPNSQIT